jgi:hypothetical protein
VDLVPDPLLLRKSGSAENRSRDLYIFNQELSNIRPQRRSQFSDMKNELKGAVDIENWRN